VKRTAELTSADVAGKKRHLGIGLVVLGYVQKITTVPGTAPQIFQFSVRDDAVARKIMEAAGQRDALVYEQHKGLPSSCFGETEYFITGDRPVAHKPCTCTPILDAHP